ncbi:MAG TPA: choice-of-anchor D domain-containing protein [Bryobacteraceae bacterium]|nr:choice-of-anchor D domain-containing protein [Bryobacteraceae bacterium]
MAVCFVRSAFAQTTSLGLSSATAVPGGSLNLGLAIAVSGTAPAGIEWTLTFPPSQISAISVTPGPAAIAAAKAISCASVSGSYTCLLAGLNINTLSSGIAANVRITLAPNASTTAVGIAKAISTDATGHGLNMSVAGPAIITVPALSSLTCAPGTLYPSGSANCSLGLNTAAPAGGVTASIVSSSSGLLTVPGSVTVPAGATVAPFTATAAANIASNQTATIAASYNGGVANSAINLNTGAASVSLAPSFLNFRSQAVNTSSPGQAITVTNSGPGLLAIGGIAIAGLNPGDFSQTNNCPISPATIPVNAFCTINVTFAPSAANARSAAVTIIDNGIGSPQSLSLSGTGLQAWPNGYSYEATFTVAAGQVPSVQTNFPALISGTFADFATAANGGRISNTCAQTAGNNAIAVPCDLIFTSDAAGTKLLNWEFETWTAATGAMTVWVNVPNLGNGTVIYAWYGQPSVATLHTTPSATWNGNFMAVYHLKENPAGSAPQLNDSTVNANQATMNGAVQSTQQQPGEISGSVNFEGNTWASIANPANFSFERTDSFSLSGWFNAPPNSSGTLLSKFQIGGAGWALIQYSGSTSSVFALGLFGSGQGTYALASTPAVTIGAWHYLVATYSGTGSVAGMKIYVDGVQQPLSTVGDNLATSIVNPYTPVINGRNGPYQMSKDSMEEIRISNKRVVFSPDWVTANFNNQSHPNTFFTVATGLTIPANGLNVGDNSFARAGDRASAAWVGPIGQSNGAPTLNNISCSAQSVAEGSTASCRIHLARVDSSATAEVRLSSSSQSIRVPERVMTRPGQSTVEFRIDAVGRGKGIVVSANLGSEIVHETVAVVPDRSKPIRVPGKQFVKIGTELRFQVSSADPVTLSAGPLPSGAYFDPAVGEFQWTPGAAQVGRHEIAFLAADQAGGVARASVSVQVESGEPVVTGIVNAASRSREAACSPGAIASIEGRWLISRTVPPDPSGGSIELGETKVLASGISIPILSASDTELNILCPDSAPGTDLEFVVQTDHGVAASVTTTVRSATPGIFSLDGSGTGQGLVFLENTSSVAMVRNYRLSAQPATSGDGLVFYATGIDHLTNVAVHIGEFQVAPRAISRLPNQAGLSQIVFSVPAGIMDSGELQLSLSGDNPESATVLSNVIKVATEMGGS